MHRLRRWSLYLALALALAAPSLAAEPTSRVEMVACPWSSTPEKLRCGYLIAPQSRLKPEGPTVKVFFSVVPSSAPPAAADPIVILPGGPGALFNPPVDYVMAGLTELGRRRDIILVDQRGVGRSEPRLWCDNSEVRRRDSQCLAQLKERGVEPAAFNSEETAHDLRDLRRALQLERWNPMGASYASRVVLRLMQIDPDGTRAAVIMAPLPLAPSLSRPDNADQRRAAWRRLVAECAADPVCARHGDLGEKLEVVAAALKGEHAPPALPPELFAQWRRLDRQHGGIEAALIRRLDWPDELPRLPRAVSDLFAFLNGRTVLDRARLDAIYAGETTEGEAARIPPIDRSYIGAVIRCREDVLPARAANGQGPAPSLGPGSVCSLFAAAPALNEPQAQPRPLLILTGAYDVRTPTAWSDEIAAQHPGAIVARMGDTGHGVSYRHPCGNALMTAFIANPGAPLDLGCVAQHARPKFEAP